MFLAVLVMQYRNVSGEKLSNPIQQMTPSLPGTVLFLHTTVAGLNSYPETYALPLSQPAAAQRNNFLAIFFFLANYFWQPSQESDHFLAICSPWLGILVSM